MAPAAGAALARDLQPRAPARARLAGARRWSHHRDGGRTLRALMSLRSLLGHPPLGLALQGGGAHGAFTWGVLDALLEQRANPIVAVSGASAGAMNALLLAHG